MNSQGKLALAGGGGAQDSRLIDEVFAGWTGAEGKMLYLPLALKGMRPFAECLKWVQAVFQPFDLMRIEMWEDLTHHQADELFMFTSIYIGGGNTYSLLGQLRESGFDQHLVEYIHQGGVVYGGSAGAAILGRDIQTVEHIDHNQIGLTETRGLNLMDNHAVWVHYQPEDDDLIEAYLQKSGHTVLALSERAGVVLEKGEMRSVGFEPACLFDRRGKHPL